MHLIFLFANTCIIAHTADKLCKINCTSHCLTRAGHPISAHEVEIRLSGPVPWAAGMHLQGNIQVNGQPRGTASYKQAYVQQEDMFYAQLTVRGVSELASSSLCLV